MKYIINMIKPIIQETGEIKRKTYTFIFEAENIKEANMKANKVCEQWNSTEYDLYELKDSDFNKNYPCLILPNISNPKED